MDNEQKFNEVTRRVHLFNSVLSKLGYCMDRENVDISALLGKSTIWRFKNSAIKYYLDIRFTCCNKYSNDSFSLYLVQENGKYLDIDEFLKNNGVTDFSSKLTRVDGQDFNTFLDDFFNAIQVRFGSELNNLLQGRVWQEQLFNWKGQR